MDNGAAWWNAAKDLSRPTEYTKGEKGCTSKHIWSFIKPQNHIFLQLHFEIDVVNMVLDNFYEFIEDPVYA
jgi:hypothetical protein